MCFTPANPDPPHQQNKLNQIHSLSRQHINSTSFAIAGPELKASLLQEEPKIETSAAPKIVLRLKIIPPKKPHHLGSSSASPIVIPNYSATVLSIEKSSLPKPKRQRINLNSNPHPESFSKQFLTHHPSCPSNSNTKSMNSKVRIWQEKGL